MHVAGMGVVGAGGVEDEEGTARTPCTAEGVHGKTVVGSLSELGSMMSSLRIRVWKDGWSLEEGG